MVESRDDARTADARSSRRRVASQLEEGIAMARQGDRAGARAIFRSIIHSNPHQEDAWLWLAWVAEDSTRSLAYLQEAQALLPPSDRLNQAIAWAEQQSEVPGESARATSSFTHLQARSPHKAGASVTEPASAGAGTAAPRNIGTWAKPARWTESPVNGEQEAKSSANRRASDSKLGTRKATKSVGDRASQLLQGATQGAARMPQHLQNRFSGPRPPRVGWDQIQKAVLPVFSVIAISVLVLFAGATLANLRSKTTSVRALVLPTPGANTTPTPVLQQRLDSLWTQIDVAWEQQDWETAIATLERLRDLDPRSEEARKRLAQAYYHRGLRLVAASKLGEAQEEFDRAIRLDAGSEELQDARNQLKMYLTGLEAYYAQDPQQVIETLGPLYERNPSFRDTTAMLGQAHYEVGMSDQDKGEWEKARDHYRTALLCLPDMPDAQKHLTEVEALITPPKRVVVDLSEQMATVYEDNQPIHIFSVCTGRASAPTVPGRYEVLDKMPMAYASTWNLDMPWWIGIYWAGGSENGFHALPLRHGGKQVLWGSSLGRPCSFGCIVLDTDDAITLYEWIGVGTVVFVNY